MICFEDYKIYGDGVHDDSEALQSLLDSGENEIFIPLGCYLISKTLKINSNTVLNVTPGARFIMDGEVQKHRGDFLITNSDHENGNENIKICGGVFDGNNKGWGNRKPDDLFDKNGYSGSVMNFQNVKGLTLNGFTVANSTTYYIRMSGIEGFKIENISFVSDAFGKNQDGLHFGGNVRNGSVKNIYALSKGQTNDDLIAINADDCIDRIENLDLLRDDFENVNMENLFAEDCHTIIRILSVDAKIKNVHIKNVYGGYRAYAVNADAARYCRAPIFKEEDKPLGVGHVENFTIENMTAYSTRAENKNPAVCIESNFDGLEIKNFKLIERFGVRRPDNAVVIKNVIGQNIILDGKKTVIQNKEEEIRSAEFTNLSITSI